MRWVTTQRCPQRNLTFSLHNPHFIYSQVGHSKTRYPRCVRHLQYKQGKETVLVQCILTDAEGIGFKHSSKAALTLFRRAVVGMSISTPSSREYSTRICRASTTSSTSAPRSKIGSSRTFEDKSPVARRFPRLQRDTTFPPSSSQRPCIFLSIAQSPLFGLILRIR